MGVVSIAALVALGSGSSAFAGATAVAPSGRWSAPVTLFVGQGSLLPSVSCASVHLCVAVGAKGSSGDGLSGATAWSRPVVIDTYGGLAAVSCVPRGACLAVGASALFGLRGVSYRFLGGKWTTGPISRSDLAAVSCPTAKFCAAVDGAGPIAHGFTFNGKSWSAPTSIGPFSSDETGYSISCPTTTFCAVTSESGQILYYKDKTWSKPTSIDALNNTLSSVSCASPAFCEAVDGSGNALTDVNGRWSKPVAVDFSGSEQTGLSPGSLTGVSCPTRTFCVTVDTGGAALLYNGSRWSSEQMVSRKIKFTSISCPTVNFCVAAGLNDIPIGTAAYVATYTAPS